MSGILVNSLPPLVHLTRSLPSCWTDWMAFIVWRRQKTQNEPIDGRKDDHRKGIPIALSAFTYWGMYFKLKTKGKKSFQLYVVVFNTCLSDACLPGSSSKLPDTTTTIYWCDWLSLIGQGLMCTEMRFILCTWFSEFCPCSSLTALPGPVWVLLNWTCKELISSL